VEVQARPGTKTPIIKGLWKPLDTSFPLLQVSLLHRLSKEIAGRRKKGKEWTSHSR
jgi:hypothetical protein